MYFAIEKIGRRYCIKWIDDNNTVWPTNGKVYQTENDAMQAAKQEGIKIRCTGDIWEIINKEEK